jgi:catechol 2,3-dioxygenase-like lactoylglutathione lyase family enzyme
MVINGHPTKEDPMIDHVSIGVRDFPRARAFYDAVFAALGAKAHDSGTDYAGYGRDVPVYWVQVSPSPVPPDMGSGLHFCFHAETRAQVDAFYKAALAQGGTDNGPPGLRPNYGPDYYAAFAIDPDGYRIEAHTHAP